MTLNREKVKQHLKAGDSVHWHVFIWMDKWMNCEYGCCDESFDSTDETLDAIEKLCEYNQVDIYHNYGKV